jgi:cholesterol oxidase
MKVPAVSRVKAGLHLPDLLSALGVETMTAQADSDPNWLESLYNRALSHYPIDLEERCDSATCHQITFMYAPLYEHDQLNQGTHQALHEMFGVANMSSFDHLAEMVRRGHLVDAGGADAYLPHLSRLAIPIAFIHGAENGCFMPASTEITFDLLRDANGADLYRRHLVPRYGHIDCIFGKNAARDVFPLILEHLEGPGA